MTPALPLHCASRARGPERSITSVSVARAAVRFGRRCVAPVARSVHQPSGAGRIPRAQRAYRDRLKQRLAGDLARDPATPEGTVVVAIGQAAGHGRRGRSWSSPAGKGLYASVLLRPGARLPPARLSAPWPPRRYARPCGPPASIPASSGRMMSSLAGARWPGAARLGGGPGKLNMPGMTGAGRHLSREGGHRPTRRTTELAR